MFKDGAYIGLNEDIDGGMTEVGKIIRDAWVFGLLDESETCEGWKLGALDDLLEQVNTEWDKYSCMVSQLPPELFEKHQRIHNAGIVKAKNAGWSGESETDDEQ